eukprot:TRINITY_DN7555_c0_g1_i2.p1 TRINITY_DN7555_c0_g1~~TRINITY_DN7555_c0_g1_i2.p1  ORF type:complete len:468 (-),score=100.94 TRINITY_DN7555_c0_g1_i2:63-1466(-)
MSMSRKSRRELYCRHCDFVGSVQVEVDRHVQREHPYFYCEECPFRTRLQKQLEDHILRAHDLFRCNCCEFACRYEEEMIGHVQKEHSLWECEFCERWLKSEKGLQAHINALHPFCCDFCDFQCKLEEEILLHLKERHWKCGGCWGVFGSEKEMLEHAKLCGSVAEKKEKSWTCGYCSFKGQSQSELDIHLQKDHTWKCEYCAQVFKIEAVLLKHVQTAHPDHHCNYCSFKSQVQAELKLHIQEKHHWECEHCHKLFKFEKGLLDHTQALHAYFNCDYCAFKSKIKEELDLHFEESHTWNCQSCDKTFHTEKSLQLHTKAVHTFFTCPECSKNFKSPNALAQHQKAVHSTNQSRKSLQLEDIDRILHLDAEGTWVERENWKSKKGKKEKSFGIFECSACDNVWPSAHAWKSLHQDCVSCNSKNLPKFMFINAQDREREEKDDEKIKNPHKSHLCEACRMGLNCVRNND